MERKQSQGNEKEVKEGMKRRREKLHSDNSQRPPHTSLNQKQERPKSRRPVRQGEAGSTQRSGGAAPQDKQRRAATRPLQQGSGRTIEERRTTRFSTDDIQMLQKRSEERLAQRRRQESRETDELKELLNDEYLSEGASRTGRTSGSGNQRINSRSMRKRRQLQQFGVLAGVVLVIVVAAIIGYNLYQDKYGLTDAVMDLNEYYGLTSEQEMAVIVDNEVHETRGILENEIPYLEYEFVRSEINGRFYWDYNENILLYTLADGSMRVEVGQTSYTKGQEVFEMGYEIVKTMGNTTYIALDFVQQWSDMTSAYFSNPSRTVIRKTWEGIKVATATTDTQVRYQGGVKSEILSEIPQGTEVQVLEIGEDWNQVRTADGIIGYAQSGKFSEPTDEMLTSDFVDQEYPNMVMDEPVNMVWHQVTSSEGNGTLMDALDDVRGVNVIAPTWFFIDSVEGDLISLASQDYVEKAHGEGLQVWGVLNDFDGTIGSQDETFQVLSNTAKRDKIINEVIAEALKTGLDGINVDIEHVNTDAGPHFIQFVRELSVKCRQNQLILSVANYPPKSFNQHYEYEEQGIVTDYVIIMGYDEFYGGSPEAGPVASIEYVREGIETMVGMVPSEKVINAIPFYSRLWESTPKTAEELAAEEGTEAAEYPNKVESSTYGMNSAVNVVAENDAEMVWDDALKLNYATWTGDEITYQIWIEDLASVEEKLKVMTEYELAGVAAWKLGLEDSEVWNLIRKYVN